MKVAFCDFWHRFEPDNNLFADLLRDIFGSIQITSRVHEADVVFYSCFGTDHEAANPSATKIFYTGENIRPDFTQCDLALSFDFDNYEGKNIRFPLWMLYINWYGKGYVNPVFALPPDQLADNEFSRKPKTKFCCIINNHLPNQREEVVNELSKYKQVDGFGSVFGNAFDAEDTHRKYEVLSEYKFSICFENANHPGYHTEKLLHAKTAGCIPLYNGDRSVGQDFNKDCFFNLQDFESVTTFCDFIKEIDTRKSLYDVILNQPLFIEPPTLDQIKDKLRCLGELK